MRTLLKSCDDLNLTSVADTGSLQCLKTSTECSAKGKN